jgi:hypothetical protein
MVSVRVRILSGEFKGQIGIMDSCGWISFVGIYETIHNSEVKWEFEDFKQK